MFGFQRGHYNEASSSKNKSFEELVLDKMKGPQEKKYIKRKKVDLKTKVITTSEYLQELKRIEEEGNKKKKPKKSSPPAKKPQPKKKRKEFLVDELESEDSSIEEETEEEIVEEDDDEEEEDNEVVGDVESGGSEDVQSDLVIFWKSLNAPNAEENIVQKWYGCVYYDLKKSPHLYVGKALRRFLVDVDGPVSGLEIECLKPHVGIGIILESVPAHHPDIDVFSVHNIIAGPLKGEKWNVEQYGNIKDKFEKVIKIDREELCNNSI